MRATAEFPFFRPKYRPCNRHNFLLLPLLLQSLNRTLQKTGIALKNNKIIKKGVQFCLEESLNGRKKIQFHTHTLFSSLNMDVCHILTHPSPQCLLSAPTLDDIIIYSPLSSSKTWLLIFSTPAQHRKTASVISGPLKSLSHASLLQLAIKGSKT